VGADSSTATQSAYVVRGAVSPEAITTSLHALLPARQRPIARHRFTLLDTFDGRVRRAGTRLIRVGVEGAAAPCELRCGNHLAVRLRQPVNFAWDLPDGPLQQALAPVIGVRRLIEQADAEQYGSLLEVLDGRGKTVARLRIESGRARLPTSASGWQPLPTMITLTGMRGYEDAYRQLVPVIESRPGLESCPDGLDGIVLREIGALEPRDVSSPGIELTRTARAGAGARQIHLALLGIINANEPGLRASLDTEFLHDFRVAIRRTRSLLGQLKQVFPAEALEHFATEFSWLGRLTGPPRDLDVLSLSLSLSLKPCLKLSVEGCQEDVPADDMEALTAFLNDIREQEHHRLVEALDSGRYRRLLSEWHAFLERPGQSDPTARNANLLLKDVVSKRAWRLSRRIVDSAETIDDRAPAERLHEVRIDAKKLRYLIDVTPNFYAAADLERVLRALKKLQRVLGDFNDAHVQGERLLQCGRAMGAAGAPAGALLAVGRLSEQSRQRRDQLRGGVLQGLARFRARDTRSACRRAFKPAGAVERTR
jgi:CHAD domain-containing protein